MKLEIARGLFLVGALVITSLAVAAWEQPHMQVISAVNGDAHCALPRVAKASADSKPDHDLLLLMFGLSQRMRPQS
ncbi:MULTISPECIES: hypothetical protein [unclassified Pseudomonas]|uniref:hypothetical protein n=1 Tax=unclassified Pseudomonas TaxID=196821 RepID=UPI002AC980BE|nr:MULTISPECIES: hypothetical protein [unclassified Pseudomonas]MEB0045066.1 hypothetical protein [Pseudomonas sp. Dout3]MEB0095922.1 hypothetical protein [Pseudomonas sp. DC1.2]WPX57789.1 hypothetical protein RHM68_19560 [Pseudomonas sp. DC1.2]